MGNLGGGGYENFFPLTVNRYIHTYINKCLHLHIHT